MSTTIGNLAVILSANAAGFSAGMAAAGKSATSFISTLGSMAKSVGAIVGISTAIGGVKKAFDGFTGAEESLITFQSLLGSASAAKKFKEELKDFGDMSPFGDGVKKAAINLLKFNFAGEEVLPTLRKLGDVAAGINVPLEEIADVVGKSGYRASITNNQLIALSEMGVPIMQELTKTTGMSQAAITQMAEQGGIKFEHLMAAFDSASSAGGNFFNKMNERANTTKNLWARIVDQAGDVVGKFGSVLGNRLSAMFGVKSAGGAFFDWLQRVEEGVKKMGPWFNDIILGFEAMGEAVRATWIGVTNVFSIGWDLIQGVLSKFGLNVQTFRDFFVDAMTSVKFVFNNFADLAASIFGRAGLVAFKFGADVVHIFTTNIPEALKWFGENWRTVFDNIAIFMDNWWARNEKGWGIYWSQTKLGFAKLISLITPEKEGVFEAALARHEEEKKKFNAIVVQEKPFKDLPAFAFSKRAVTEGEKNFEAGLNAIDRGLAEAKAKAMGGPAAGQGNFITDFLMSAIGMGKGRGGPMDMATAAAKSTGETRRAGAFEVGSKEAYNVMIRSRDQSMAPANRTAKATEESAKRLGQIVDLSKQIKDNSFMLPVGALDGGSN